MLAIRAVSNARNMMRGLVMGFPLSSFFAESFFIILRDKADPAFCFSIALLWVFINHHDFNINLFRY